MTDREKLTHRRKTDNTRAVLTQSLLALSTILTLVAVLAAVPAQTLVSSSVLGDAWHDPALDTPMMSPAPDPPKVTRAQANATCAPRVLVQVTRAQTHVVF